MSKPAGTGIERRTLSVAAADEIRRRILSGHYPEGLQLRQDALAGDLGVSRVPVREALVQLEAEGLVRIVPHRGAVVTELSVADIRELFALRAMLEPRLLRHSAPHLTGEDFAALDAILAQYSTALRTHDISRWGALNTELHSRLYSRASQPRTRAIVEELLQNIDRYVRLQIAFTQTLERAEQEHAAIVDACRAGDVELGCRLLIEHINHAGEALATFLARRPDR